MTDEIKPMHPSTSTLGMLQDFLERHRGRMASMKAEADALALEMDAIDVQDETSAMLAGLALGAAQHKRRICQQVVKPIKDVLRNTLSAMSEQERDAVHKLYVADAKLRAALLAYQNLRDRRMLSEQERIQRDEDEKRQRAVEEEIAVLVADGRVDEAEALRNYEPVTAPVVLARAPFSGGPGKARRWRAEVTSLAALVKAVAAGQVSIKAVKANKAYLNAQARAAREAFLIPGCEAVCKESLMVRRRKSHENQ